MSHEKGSFDGRFLKFFDNSSENQRNPAAYGVRSSQCNRFIQQQQEQPPNQRSVFCVPVMPAQMPMMPQKMVLSHEMPPPFFGIQQAHFPPLRQVSAPRRTVADFNSCLFARRQDEKIKQLEQKCKEMQREKEESSKFSIKRVSIASDSEDYECSSLGSGFSKQRKKKKSHRRRSHKSKKKGKKSKHYRKSSSASSSSNSSRRSSSSSVEVVGSLSKYQCHSPSIKVENIFNVKNNPWKLLRMSEYSYRTTHLVMDTSGDPKNLLRDRSCKYDVAKHNSLDGALSTLFGAIPFAVNAFHTKDERYFDLLRKGSGENQEAERFFRSRKPVGVVDVEPIPISFSKYVPRDDEMVSNNVANMNLDVYEDYQKSKFLSWEEARLEEMRALLSTRVNLEPTNVNAWIKFVRLQSQLIAFEESGDGEAEVINKRALYHKKQSILNRALRLNPSSITLRLEQLDVAEAYFGPNSQEISEMERCLIREYPSSIQMWEALMQKKQNNSLKFEKNKMINFIDACLSNIVGIRKNSLDNDAVADKFLVSLIVHRCKLLMECGFADQAVASLQALTEFHFFPLVDQACMEIRPEEKFEDFWMKNLPRIGDKGAVGWQKSETNELTLIDENDVLENRLHLMKQEELILVSCYEKNFSTAEAWRRLETFRDQVSWQQIRNPNIPSGLYKFSSLNISFEQVRPLLFTFTDKSFAENLVYRILQLFGVVIPGMRANSYEEILRRLSSDHFPSISTKYEGMPEFLDRFLMMLSSARDVDVARILSSRELTFAKFELSRLDLDVRAKEKLLYSRVQNLISSTDVDEVDKKAVFLYLSKSFEQIGTVAGSLKFINGLLAFFSGLSISMWSIQSHKERLIYLKAAKALCRRLPSANEISDSGARTIARKEFLLALAINGNTQQLSSVLEQKDRASHSWLRCLKDSANGAPSKFYWLGNEAEIILELAATFYSEITESGPMMKWKIFEKAVTQSPLARSIDNRPIVKKLCCKYYSNQMKMVKTFSPKVLIRLLKDAMSKFPESIFFVKNFVDVSNVFDAVIHLQKNRGFGQLQRQIRSCALIFLRQKKWFGDYRSQVHFVQELIAIATRDDAELFLIDAYLWVLLLSLDAVKDSTRKIEEVFALGRKHCPWSKQFLMEVAKTRGPFGDFLPGLKDIFDSSGLHMHCLPDEISSLLRH